MPEACHVDVAVAAALSVYLARVQDSGDDVPAPIQSLLADTLRILESRGFDPKGARRKTMSRLLYRRDRATLQSAVHQSPRSKSL